MTATIVAQQAINGNSSLPLWRNGAKIARLIAQPSSAPTASATAMLAR